MSNIQIYDKALCCETGICGPDVDPVLPRFAADVKWLKSQGHLVVRFNLAQQPDAFVKNRTIQRLIEREGVECLPIIVVDGQVTSRSEYPPRTRFLEWTGTTQTGATPSLIPDGEAGCGPSGCGQGVEG